MSRIAELGNEILLLQSSLGLPNSQNLNPGLSEQQISQCPLFSEVPVDSELQQFYSWRNGSVTQTGIPMSKLWFVPGHYLIPASQAVLSNQYIGKNPLPSWEPTWFPLMQSGSGDFHFFKKTKISDGKVPIFYTDTEFSPGLWQIYDSIESMFTAVLECYAEGAYFVGDDGFLTTDARRETVISKRFNPKSDHWKRVDLF